MSQENLLNQDIWNDSRTWFNNMEVQSRNQLILTMYKLCLSIKDLSHEKLTETINNSWNEKMSKQLELTDKLTLENEILSKSQKASVFPLMEKLRDIESNITNTMNNISQKITPSTNGKLGEDYIDQLLSCIPNSEFSNRTQSKGGGDFLFCTGGIRIMIESKNWTNSSIKGNPKELENFKQNAIEAHENNDIDFAIIALHRVTDLKGKAIDIERVFSKRGNLILLYVTNLFNHPDRILYAIDTGILLLSQSANQSIDIEKFLFQINNFISGIDNLDESIKDRFKMVKDMNLLIKKDSNQITKLRQMLENILYNNNKIPIKDRVVNYCAELITLKGEENVSKTVLETKLLEHKIPARNVRELGGIKEIKKLAIKKLNNSENNEDIDEDEVSEVSEVSED